MDSEKIPGIGKRLGFFESGANLLFFSALAFLLGVFLANAAISVLRAALFFLTVLCVVFFWKRPPKKFVILPFILFLFGLFYFHFYINFRSASESIPIGTAEFSGVIVGEPETSFHAQSFLVRLEAPHIGKVKVFARPFEEFAYGDRLVFQGRLKGEGAGVYKTAWYPEVISLEPDQGFWFKAKLLEIKSGLIGQFQKFLPSEHAALISGITFGYRADFTPRFKEEMAESGTTHLVALSGYNIAILGIAIAATLGYFLSRRVTFFITTAVIGIFILGVGAAASIVRAGIMGFLLLLSRHLGRSYHPENPIALAAAFMALFDPTVFRSDPGFLLSFSSLLGIVYLGPAIKAFLARKYKAEFEEKTFLGWKENIITTISAQLGAMPVVIAFFKAVSLTSLLSNALILGAVPLTMGLGFALAASGALFAPLAAILAWPAQLLLGYEIFVIKFFGSAVPAGFIISPWIAIPAYYMALGAFVWSERRRKKKKYDEGQ